MGNRSSSPPYPQHSLPYGKRPPAAFIEPYVAVDFPPRGHPHHYGATPQAVFLDRRLGGSRLSLNAIPTETPVIIPDLKTLKKLEKMDKKQRKIMKKLGLAPIPPPHFLPPPPRYPSPPQMYSSRALSVDDLHRNEGSYPPRCSRAQLDRAESRLREQWRRLHPRQEKSTVSSTGTSRDRSSLSSSSPVTSSSEAPTVDVIGTGKDNRNRSYEGTRIHEVRVERREHQETNNYALPIVRGQYGSRSSLGTTQMRTDQSEIDFSWVSEEEEKLRSEGRNQNMPECYFGAEGSELRQTYGQPANNANEAMSCGPSERRLHRMQRNEMPTINDRQKWRSSLAF